MLISIITINYNNLEGLKRTVRSVLNQTLVKDIEYIIIDGGSSDGSADFLNTLPSNIKWISEKDRGISDAFNKGINFATGDYVLCLNSGDCFTHNRVIEKAINDLHQYKVDILSYRVHVSDNVFIPQVSHEKQVYESCTEPHQGTFVKRNLHDTVGLYSEEYKIRMDYHFFARCRYVGTTFKYINEDIVEYEEGGTSMKPENRIRFWKEGLSVKLQYGLKIDYKDLIKFVIHCNR